MAVYMENSGEKMVQRWLSSIGGDPDLERVVLDGIKSLPERLDNLEKAIEKNIQNHIKFIAHSMKGGFGSIGATEVYKLCVGIDEEMKKGNYNINIVKGLFAELRDLVNRIPNKYLEKTGTNLNEENCSSSLPYDTRKTVVLGKTMRERLAKIIADLKENFLVFNQKQIIDIADSLRYISSDLNMDGIKDELYTAAKNFDDEALKRIVIELERL